MADKGGNAGDAAGGGGAGDDRVLELSSALPLVSLPPPPLELVVKSFPLVSLVLELVMSLTPLELLVVILSFVTSAPLEPLVMSAGDLLPSSSSSS